MTRPIEIKIPEVGESITEVQISEWLKKEGDTVKADEAIAVIDSEKTTFELPAPKDGVLTRILHQSGETIPVGEVVAQIESDGQAQKTEAAPAKPKTEPGKTEKAKEKSRAQKPSQQKSAAESHAKDSDRETQKRTAESESNRKAESPAAEKQKPESQAPEQRQNPEIEPQPKAAQRAKPAEEAITSPPAALPSDREEEVIPMTMLRRTVARRLVEAQQTMAMLTTFSEADMSAVQALRKEHQEAFQKRYNVKLGLMSFFAKAAVDALKQFPPVNAEIRGNDIVYRNYYDLGIAIASERGLVVPVLRNADRLSFAETEKAISEFARLAREGKLRPEDLAGGTFTISNGGVYGSLLSTPIINPPQSAILGLHAIQDRPVAIQGQVSIRPMMYLALTYDHRLVDGREAVLFLRRIKESIESPSRLLLEI